ncbi:NAD(P)H-binding protein [Streptomyces sp. NPDC048484]|uniref:NAD(P)H-binding protein n=1 Tax=Streptomyces sp. NPDC048484 TaxID=3155146 RepID=UPI0034163497
MKVVIAGGHGKVALLLEQLLTERGDVVTGLIRNPAQAEALEKAGAQARLVDLEKATSDEVARHLTGAGAVVFAAGAGPGSSVGRKDSVDRGAAILLALLDESRLTGRTVEVIGGSTPIADAVAAHAAH